MSETLETKTKKINSVSPCFCLAKWLQVTIDLVNGTTHSCHHPKRHVIPLQELEANPSALHNTSFKKEQRKKMLAGERPPECVYCWEAEDSGVTYSDRIIKTTDPWAWSELDRIAKTPWNADVTPTFLEVMLDDLCNFACGYCHVEISTGVAADHARHGNYKVKNIHGLPINEKKLPRENLYVEAFWTWLPEILGELQVLRVTGGEPLISPRLPKLFELLRKSRNPKLSLAVNSHLNHRAEKFAAFLDEVGGLLADGHIREFELFTSLDTFGPAGEFIRHGMHYPTVLENIDRAARALPGRVVIMCAFHVLGIADFDRFLDDVIELKKRHPERIVLDIASVRSPLYLRADLADDFLRRRLEDSLWKMRGAPEYFTPHETAKLENVVTWASRPKNEAKVREYRADLFRFVRDYEKRKKKDFDATYPEYRNFLIECKRAIFETLPFRAPPPPPGGP